MNIIIIGGGISGLISAVLLQRCGFDVTLIEKRTFPFHRVCGEYISNEVLPFLRSLNIHVDELHPSRIEKLSVNTAWGKRFTAPLDLGGFGLSRFAFDHLLYKKAKAEGVHVIEGKKVNEVLFEENQFTAALADNFLLHADLVIGAFGKRSNLDQKLRRKFFYKRSPYLGVKYHIKTDFPTDLIQLNYFEGGYCGLSKIEDEKYCLCYLSENRSLKKYGSIKALEEEVLYKNRFLRHHFQNADFLFDKPEVINEISFEQKSLVENHILFCGDAAGMITPLCGNGMAMAVHSSKILAEAIDRNREFNHPAVRRQLELEYEQKWKQQFAFRMRAGRRVQNLMRNQFASSSIVSLSNKIPAAAKFIISLTHGKSF